MTAADVGLVIPTRGDHPDLLADIIASSGLPAARIVIVSNGPRALSLANVPATVLVDIGERNIHRWWNRGIDWLVARGARRIAVLNDDVRIAGDTLAKLADALGPDLTVAPTLALAGRKGSPSGHCWMLNTTHGIRPDESYTWWCGDLQLQADAATAGGVVRVPGAYCQHLHHNQATVADPELSAAGAADNALYDARNPSGPASRNMGWL